MACAVILKMVSVHMDKKGDNEHCHSSDTIWLFFLGSFGVSGENVNILLLSQFTAKLSKISRFLNIKINRHFGSGLSVQNFQVVG